jgi:hypothetical protein
VSAQGDDGPPYRGIQVRANARLSLPEDRSIIRRIATRYLGPEAGEQYAEGRGDDLLIRLEPGELRPGISPTTSPERGARAGT